MTTYVVSIEWAAEMARGKSACLAGEPFKRTESGGWRHGWKFQNAKLMEQRREISAKRDRDMAARMSAHLQRNLAQTVSLPVPRQAVPDDAVMRRRMMGSGRFVR